MGSKLNKIDQKVFLFHFWGKKSWVPIKKETKTKKKTPENRIDKIQAKHL